MSYCRWSSMNWMSDVYVYEHVGGYWITHVAGRRRVLPPIPDVPFHRLPRLGAKWDREARRAVYPSRLHAMCARVTFRFSAFWHNRIHMGSMRLIPFRSIGLQYDGEAFTDSGPGECADRLEQLRALGYRVPSHAIHALREEAATHD